jgi:predicted metal-binding membrane protein
MPQISLAATPASPFSEGKPRSDAGVAAADCTCGCAIMTNTRTDSTSLGAPIYVLAALLFVAGLAVTVYMCRTMSGGMDMPGGWNMSMAWMRMAGQSRFGATAMFMVMWIAMMPPMMLPSLLPMLAVYRRCVGGSVGLTVIAGTAYFLAWGIFGAIAYPIGIGLAAAEMHWDALAKWVPTITSVVLILVGCAQLSRWKARQLTCCRNAKVCGKSLSPDAWNAFRHGIQLGLHCSLCCLGLMIALLVINVMDLRTMALVTAAITIERLAPRPVLAARIIGGMLIVAGAVSLVRAISVM